MSTFRRETGGLPPEQQAIRERCFHPTSTAIEFKKEDVEQSIPARFEEQVRKFASKVAITVGDREIT